MTDDVFVDFFSKILLVVEQLPCAVPPFEKGFHHFCVAWYNRPKEELKEADHCSQPAHIC